MSATAAGRDFLEDGGSGPRVIVAVVRWGVREIGWKENQEQEATGAGPLVYSAGLCKNPNQSGSSACRPINPE